MIGPYYRFLVVDNIAIWDIGNPEELDRSKAWQQKDHLG